MYCGRKRRCRPWLVVVLQKAGKLILKVRARAEVLAHGPSVLLSQSVVQALVVGVVEALLLQRPFHVPVDLGHEQEVRMFPSHGLGRLRPEGIGPDAPGAFEHSGHDEHGHVAAHAIALAGDSLQLADHCLLQFRVGIVELQRVGPTVKVRVSAVGEQQRPVFRFHPAVILG